MTFQDALKKLKSTSPLRITISGDIGSGKSTFAKQLAQELDLPRIYIGQFMREEAAKRGLTLDEFSKLQESDDTIDKYMDSLQHEKSKELERGIFEGRVAWHFAIDPKIKIFLGVDPQAAATRIWNDKNDQRDKYSSIDELAQANITRRESEEKRYNNYYGISAYSPENFNIIIDTSGLSIKQVFEKTVREIADFLTKNQ